MYRHNLYGSGSTSGCVQSCVAGPKIHGAGLVRCADMPWRAQFADFIPGVDALTAAAIVAEIGMDMAVFGTAQRLAA